LSAVSPRFLELAAADIEALATKAIAGSSNMLVPWYLMLSYLYYIHDLSPTSDDFYDRLCKQLLVEFDTLEHRHKGYVDKDALSAGTGYYLKFEGAFGAVVAGACKNLLTDHMPWLNLGATH
jgi:hypothetical protein